MFRLTNLWPIVFLLICFLWTSFYGLNFGSHWDEDRAKFDSVRDSLKTGLFVQAPSFTAEGGSYNHGGLNYLLTWLGFTPEILRYVANGPHTREALSQAITPIIYTTSVRFRVRAIYVILSSLSIVWLFLLSLLMGRSRLEAFLAVAVLTFSWEFAYHSRWVAPDVIMTQFALLTFLCVAIHSTSKRLQWLYFGAIAAGLAMGTKYTGALILPFFLVGAGHTLWQQRPSVAYVLKQSLGLIGSTDLTFVLTTPGAVLDPFRFFYQIQEQREIYAAGWYGYTVKPGVSHFFEMLKYFFLQVFSHYWSISTVLALFGLLGIILLLREHKLFTFLAAGFCLLHLAFFSQQSALIVRNLLVVVPFLALAIARGITETAQRLGARLKPILYAGVGVLLAVNFGWEVYAARQIKLRFHPEHFFTQFEQYAQRSPNDTFLVSAKLSNALHVERVALPANVVTDPGVSYTKVALLQTEGPKVYWETWPSNAWGIYDKVFGPLEVNLEAYSTFIGNERILVLKKNNFLKLPIHESDLTIP